MRRVKSPQIPVYNAIYRGYDCIYNWEGPPSKLLTYIFSDSQDHPVEFWEGNHGVRIFAYMNG